MIKKYIKYVIFVCVLLFFAVISYVGWEFGVILMPVRIEEPSIEVSFVRAGEEKVKKINSISSEDNGYSSMMQHIKEWNRHYYHDTSVPGKKEYEKYHEHLMDHLQLTAQTIEKSNLSAMDSAKLDKCVNNYYSEMGLRELLKTANFSDSKIEDIVKNSMIEMSKEDLQNLYNNIIYTCIPVKYAIEKPYCVIQRDLNDPDKILHGLCAGRSGLGFRLFMLLCEGGGEFLLTDGRYDEGLDMIMTGYYCGSKLQHGFNDRTDNSLIMSIKKNSLNRFLIKIREIPVQNKEFYEKYRKIINNSLIPDTLCSDCLVYDYLMFRTLLTGKDINFTPFQQKREVNGLANYYIALDKVIEKPYRQVRDEFELIYNKYEKYFQRKKLLSCCVYASSQEKFIENVTYVKSYEMGTSIVCALYSYYAERGVFPEKLQELVPSYMEKVPEDPFARDGKYRYVKNLTGFMLYSVGADGIDGGGKNSKNEYGRIQEEDIIIFYNTVDSILL